MVAARHPTEDHENNRADCGAGFQPAAAFRRLSDELHIVYSFPGYNIGVIRCDQPRALDLRARDGRKLEVISSEIMDEVIARLSPIFD
jgi:hypothetical protein